MRNVLQFTEANELLHPYYNGIMECLDKCFSDCNLLYDTFSQLAPASFKNRTKGSFVADRLKVYMNEKYSGDANIRLTEASGVFGIIISDKIFIRFNKMDAKFGVSINRKTKQSKKYINQIPLNGLADDLTLIWCGFNPDRPWINIMGYYLVCYNGSLNWHYDMGRNNSTQQLSIELPNAPAPAKRVRVKTKKDDNEKTGTND